MVGVLDFIPLMRYSYDWVPARPFALVGYVMFAYLFSWTDTHWFVAFQTDRLVMLYTNIDRLRRRKAKIFRFTPTPVRWAYILLPFM